tara:strand:+ start:184 stop:405 length:222 start_codon:yes stop_codon:yes gene_type:complete
MYPVPITRIKINKDRWLEIKIKYEDNMCIRDILERMSHKIYTWMGLNEDITIIIDYESFKNKFIQVMYDKYVR